MGRGHSTEISLTPFPGAHLDTLPIAVGFLLLVSILLVLTSLCRGLALSPACATGFTIRREALPGRSGRCA